MVIVTAANRKYFGGLINLVGSIHYWSEHTQILVYDLGIGDKFLQEARTWRNVTIVEEFVDQQLPEHCQNLLNYAWKPFAMADAISQHRQILWVDAGSDLRGPLKKIQKQLQADQHFFVQGQDLDMTKQSMSASYEAMGTHIESYTGKPHFAGNLQGYVRNSDAHIKILKPLKHYAAEKACIAPPGSSLLNHRFDQTLLSILVYQSALEIEPQTHLLAAERQQLQKDPFQKSDRLVFTARLKSREYMSSVIDKSGRARYQSLSKQLGSS